MKAQVTGVVKEAFSVAVVEEDLNIELNDEALEDWVDEPYLQAVDVDTWIDADL